MEPRFSKDMASISDLLKILLGNTAPRAVCETTKVKIAIVLNDIEAISEMASSVRKSGC